MTLTHFVNYAGMSIFRFKHQFFVCLLHFSQVSGFRGRSSRHFFFFTSFLECSGPLDNARTIPEWLKNNLNFFEKMFIFLTIVISK